jgi:hypothetical protein
MTLFSDLPPGDGDLLTVFRCSSARRWPCRSSWPRPRSVATTCAGTGSREYAIGLGAGTQVLTHVPWTLLVGAPGEFTRALLMAAGWVINLVVAEWGPAPAAAGPRRRQAGGVTRPTCIHAPAHFAKRQGTDSPPGDRHFS